MIAERRRPTHVAARNQLRHRFTCNACADRLRWKESTLHNMMCVRARRQHRTCFSPSPRPPPAPQGKAGFRKGARYYKASK
ncbi:unnamed protein product [Colias eurytheme]|nr:unnamed protein product [Colias eurytheme]